MPNQALDLYVPVQRFEVLIRRRKGERLVRLDWHSLVKMAEPPVCEAGLALLWQIYSRRCALQIHLRQCGQRCGGQSSDEFDDGVTHRW